MTDLARVRLAALLCAAGLLAAGCSGEPAPRGSATVPQEEILQAGAATVRATVMQTAALSEAVAAQYGIERDEGTVMLLVGAREGPAAQEVSVPAAVSATATDLRGNRHPIEMRELHAGGLVDQVGTLRVDLPETLAFDVEIRREGAPPARMQFSRDFAGR
jgi:hypothetical protein